MDAPGAPRSTRRTKPSQVTPLPQLVPQQNPDCGRNPPWQSSFYQLTEWCRTHERTSPTGCCRTVQFWRAYIAGRFIPQDYQRSHIPMDLSHQLQKAEELKELARILDRDRQPSTIKHITAGELGLTIYRDPAYMTEEYLIGHNGGTMAKFLARLSHLLDWKTLLQPGDGIQFDDIPHDPHRNPGIFFWDGNWFLPRTDFPDSMNHVELESAGVQPKSFTVPLLYTPHHFKDVLRDRTSIIWFDPHPFYNQLMRIQPIPEGTDPVRYRIPFEYSYQKYTLVFEIHGPNQGMNHDLQLIRQTLAPYQTLQDQPIKAHYVDTEPMTLLVIMVPWENGTA